jgi:hypothetical protein
VLLDQGYHCAVADRCRATVERWLALETEELRDKLTPLPLRHPQLKPGLQGKKTASSRFSYGNNFLSPNAHERQDRVIGSTASYLEVRFSDLCSKAFRSYWDSSLFSIVSSKECRDRHCSGTRPFAASSFPLYISPICLCLTLSDKASLNQGTDMTLKESTTVLRGRCPHWWNCSGSPTTRRTEPSAWATTATKGRRTCEERGPVPLPVSQPMWDDPRQNCLTNWHRIRGLFNR